MVSDYTETVFKLILMNEEAVIDRNLLNNLQSIQNLFLCFVFFIVRICFSFVNLQASYLSL